MVAVLSVVQSLFPPKASEWGRISGGLFWGQCAPGKRWAPLPRAAPPARMEAIPWPRPCHIVSGPSRATYRGGHSALHGGFRQGPAPHAATRRGRRCIPAPKPAKSQCVVMMGRTETRGLWAQMTSTCSTKSGGSLECIVTCLIVPSRVSCLGAGRHLPTPALDGRRGVHPILYPCVWLHSAGHSAGGAGGGAPAYAPPVARYADLKAMVTGAFSDQDPP